MRIWNDHKHAYLPLFKPYSKRINCIRFSSDGRLFLSSESNSIATIVTFNARFQPISFLKLEGHGDYINEILPLHSSQQCVTCSDDRRLKVWDCQTGACLRTLKAHSSFASVLALHPTKPIFASGAYDDYVYVWSTETFDLLRECEFQAGIQALEFDDTGHLFVSVDDYGIMSWNMETRTIRRVVRSDKPDYFFGLAVGKLDALVLLLVFGIVSLPYLSAQFLLASRGLLVRTSSIHHRFDTPCTRWWRRCGRPPECSRKCISLTSSRN